MSVGDVGDRQAGRRRSPRAVPPLDSERPAELVQAAGELDDPGLVVHGEQRGGHARTVPNAGGRRAMRELLGPRAERADYRRTPRSARARRRRTSGGCQQVQDRDWLLVGGGAAMLVFGLACSTGSIEVGGVDLGGGNAFDYFFTGGIAVAARRRAPASSRSCSPARSCCQATQRRGRSSSLGATGAGRVLLMLLHPARRTATTSGRRARTAAPACSSPSSPPSSRSPARCMNFTASGGDAQRPHGPRQAQGRVRSRRRRAAAAAPATARPPPPAAADAAIVAASAPTADRTDRRSQRRDDARPSARRPRSG